MKLLALLCLVSVCVCGGGGGVVINDCTLSKTALLRGSGAFLSQFFLSNRDPEEVIRCVFDDI